MSRTCGLHYEDRKLHTRFTETSHLVPVVKRMGCACDLWWRDWDVVVIVKRNRLGIGCEVDRPAADFATTLVKCGWEPIANRLRSECDAYVVFLPLHNRLLNNFTSTCWISATCEGPRKRTGSCHEARRKSACII